ncbi:MAG: MBL fold metallo-hydrolase [Chloroflexi bacterium]|nr:MBL fold metallo-hydrolase [Chloroflexota bacterium]
MQQVSQNIYVETGFHGCNVGVLVTPEGLVMIDSPFSPSDAQVWKKELARLGQITYLVNTEHHIDHTTCNYFFPCPVIGTDQARAALDNPQVSEAARRRALELAPEAAPLLEGFKLRIPTICFSERMCLFVGGQEVRLIRLPGHTTSGLAVHIPQEGVVFTGDDIVCRQGPSFHEALPTQWRRSIDRIESLGASIVVPGHGEVCDSGYIAEFRTELEATLGAIREAIDQGLTKEETVERTERIDCLSKYEIFRAGVPEARLQFSRVGVRRLYELFTGEIQEV